MYNTCIYECICNKLTLVTLHDQCINLYIYFDKFINLVLCYNQTEPPNCLLILKHIKLSFEQKTQYQPSMHRY